MLRRIRGTQIRTDLQLSYLDLKSFFPPLTGQPKKLTHDAIPAAPPWYHQMRTDKKERQS